MIDLFRVFMADDVPARVAETLRSGYVGQGQRVEEYEAAFARLVGAEVVPLALNSCTSALDLSFHLLGIGRGDVVISTPQTCTATNTGLVTRGARIAWADIDPHTGLIDPASVAQLIERYPETKAVVAVDWAGRACDYRTLRLLGRPVIEDAAHALLARVPMADSVAVDGGDFVCWSTQSIKHLTTVDGGMLLPPVAQLERARLLRWYGLDRRSKADFRCSQDIVEAGFKAHLNDVAATVGLANIAHAPWIVERHRSNARSFDAGLAGIDAVTLPPADPGCSYWLYTILTPRRDEFTAFMGERGIATSQVHRRNDEHTAFRAATINPEDDLPGVRYFSDHQASIPVGWWLSDEDLWRVVGAVRAWGRRAVGAA